MAQDIFLTDSGDFSFFTNTDFLDDSFTFNFHMASTNSLLFNFYVVNLNEHNSVPLPAILEADRFLETLDEIHLIIDAKEKERIYIESIEQMIEVVEVHPIMPIEDDDSIIQTVITRYKNIYYSGDLKYNFYLYTPKYDKKIKSISGKEFIHQNIKLRLSTEINTIRENWDMGCDLHTIMHSSIPDNRLQIAIERMIKDSISDLLPNATVSVTLLNTNYLDYHDSIKVVIINDEDVYYYVI